MKHLWKYLKSRMPVLLLALCIMTSAVVSMVYGKYVDSINGTANLNVIAEGKLEITVSDPTVDGTYTITNTAESNIPAYVRFAVVVNWQEDGTENLWAVPPEKDSDYTITVDGCTPLADGYYYYNGIRYPDNVNENNSSFTVTVAPKGSGKTGYTLHVQILAEGIQSVPESAAENAWNAKFNGSTWIAVTTP